MHSEDAKRRLSQISTIWTLVTRAADGATKDGAANAALVERYHSAVYRYLIAATRDPDAADELFQEFALKLVRGDFGNANPEKGRFRNYIKTALINLVISHQRKQRDAPGPIPSAADPSAPAPDEFESDQDFLANWRNALLDRAWEALSDDQGGDGSVYYSVLRLRSEQPEMTTVELAERLSAHLRLESPYSEAAVRKVLQRARDRFTDILVEEVARSLRCSTAEILEEELIDLGFHPFCRRALLRQRKGFIAGGNSPPSEGTRE
jgi:RNA polymerase sigma-70 factor (ECF subfamily)